MNHQIQAFLSSRGVTETDIAAAESGGTLLALVVESMALTGGKRYTESELAQASGVGTEDLRALWRAMGFAALQEGTAGFVEDDLKALQTAQQSGGLSLEAVVDQTRVMSASMARVAEKLIDSMAQTLGQFREAGLAEDDIALLLIENFNLDDIEWILGYILRRQLAATAWRRFADPSRSGSQAEATVGFIDLVRFTAVTESVADEELERIVARFGELAQGMIADRGGQLVKMIGDAVMFVIDRGEDAVRLALDLVHAYADDELVPQARAGLSCGRMLAREGDYFGPSVNLAARIVDVARPNRVVVSNELRSTLSSDPGLTFRRLPPKRLKGIGVPPLWAAARVG